MTTAPSHHGTRVSLGSLDGYLADGLDQDGRLCLLNVPAIIGMCISIGQGLPEHVADADGVTALPLARTREEGIDPYFRRSDVATRWNTGMVARLGVDLLHVPAGHDFPEHSHPGHHLLYVVHGRGTFTYRGHVIETQPGDLYMAEANVPHAVGAIDDHYLLSFGAPHRHVASLDRMTVLDDANPVTGLPARDHADHASQAHPGEQP